MESITSGKFHNQAAKGVESAVSCMMARTAAYTGHGSDVGGADEVEGSRGIRRLIWKNWREVHSLVCSEVKSCADAWNLVAAGIREDDGCGGVLSRAGWRRAGTDIAG